MSNDKQTLIDWLINQQCTIIPTIYVKQAKQMEKEIIIQTYIAAKMERNVVKKHFAYHLKLERVTEKAEQYYNETYNNEQQ